MCNHMGNLIRASPGQNATGQNATGQNVTGQNATGQQWNLFLYFLQMLFQFVALPFNMSQPLVISAYHKLCFAHTTLITGTPRHEH